MRLFDDIRLIESEILALPIVSTIEHSIDRTHGPASYELGDS